MNVLVWNSWITPAGGMERVALSLANGLATRGSRVLLVGPYQDVPVLHAAIDKGVEFIHCAFERSAAGLLRNARFLGRLVRDRRIDVVSAHGSLIPLLRLDVPVVWTEHGPRYGDGEFLRGAKALPWYFVRARLRSSKWKFVGCSEYVRDRVCSKLSLEANCGAVIYNGVPNAPSLKALPPPNFTRPYKIGFLGRLEPEKHPMDVLALDELMASRGVPCEWRVYGDGSLAAALGEKCDGHPRIRLCGLAANAAAAFSELDVLAFLSHGQREGLPTVMLEARLARRTVVAWNVTANPEAAGPADVLVPELFDLSAFADALENVLAKAAIPPPVSTEISYERMIEQYETVLRESCRLNGASSS